MAELWLPGARRDDRAWTGYTMDRTTTSRRATWHTTENGQSATLDGIADYMATNAGLGTGYTVLLHPSTGDILQLRPADVGAGSLRTVSGYPSYNKSGTVHIQLSVCAYAAEPWWSKYPCPWMPAVIDWLRTWGIADAEVAVPVGNGRMSESAWRSAQSGHAAHRTVPNQDHTDAGTMPPPWTLTGGEPALPEIGDDAMGVFVIKDGEPGAGSALLVAAGHKYGINNGPDREACKAAFGQADISRDLYDRINRSLPEG